MKKSHLPMMASRRSSAAAWLLLAAAVAAGSVRLSAQEPAAAAPPQTGPGEPLRQVIDRLIDAKAAAEGAAAASDADDAEFHRRAYLDLTGSLPTTAQTREFLASTDANKRQVLVERLVASPEFTRQMTRVFDLVLMRRLPAQHVPAAEWQAWLHKSLAENRPWPEIARDILSVDGTDPALRPAARFYLDRGGDVHTITQDVGSVFLGMNLQCAQCHNHPQVEGFRQKDYYGLAAFFIRSSLAKEGDKMVFAENAEAEVVFENVFEIRDKVSPGPKSTLPHLPGGPLIEEPKFDFGQGYERAPAKDVRGIPLYSRRAQLGPALMESGVTRLRRTFANRIWATLFGRGIVEPVDMDHEDNPPSHPELLQALTDHLAATNDDLRGLVREIALSRTYQRSSLPASDPPPPAELFAVFPLRPLTPEQFALSMLEATGQTGAHRAALGAGLTEEALYQRTLPVEQQFVNLFGGEPGKPSKSFDPSIQQALYLSNDGTVLGWLNPYGGNLVERLMKFPPEEAGPLADELYLSVVCRKPTAEETDEVRGYLADRSGDRLQAVQELVWALLMSVEFRFNH